MLNFFKRIVARLRLSKRLICEMSARDGLVSRGPHHDYHDYPDSVEGSPWHFVELTCKRCGKQFYI